MSQEYLLPIPDNGRRRLSIAWLWLGLAALLASGLFAVLLVLSRTPYTQDIFPWVNFFRTALVVHVDLSVLVWFLAMAGVLWSLNSTKRFLPLGWAALVLATTGSIIMIIAPFSGDGQPLMSNYIPVLQEPVFITGLLLFAFGICLLTWRSMTSIPKVGEFMSAPAALRFGLNTTAVSLVVAIMAFTWSYLAIPDIVNGRAYYELLFWGGGHMLQFTYTLLMLVAWLWLVSASGMRLPISPRVVLVLFALGLVTVFLAPIIYYAYDVTTPEHIKLFTWLMQYGGSLATLPLALAVMMALFRSPKPHDQQRPLRAALIVSVILFGSGGLIGFFIHGTNVTIPAHYHGCIVGITLALMGLSYDLLPRLGFSPVRARLAQFQAYLYGGGQLLHVLGLLWSGGYGVQRKVAGAAQGIDNLEKVLSLGTMGLGGFIAILGGVLYLYIVFQAIWQSRKTNVVNS